MSRRMSSARVAVLRPQTWAQPASGLRRQAKIFIVVVLPAPLGPMKPKISPGPISMVRLSRAVREPKRLVRPWHLIMWDLWRDGDEDAQDAGLLGLEVLDGGGGEVQRQVFDA